MTQETPLFLEKVQEKRVYTPNQLALLDLHNLPQHIAIVMDGNRRWAKQRGVPYALGHWEGAAVLTEIVRAAAELGAKVLTVYAFSTENWARTEAEVEALMSLFETYLTQQRELLIRDRVRLETIGDIARLPERVRAALEKTRRATSGGDRIDLVLALNYGGRDEIRRAIHRLMEEHREVPLSEEELTEELFARYLDTAQWPDPELFIRTSGEKRISNFLLWQMAYTELYVTDVLWPDFSPQELYQALLFYQDRRRRRGI